MKHRLLILTSLLALGISPAIQGKELGFAGKLPDPREWETENPNPEPDSLWVKLAKEQGKSYVEFNDQSPNTFIALRNKLPEAIAYDMRTRGFSLTARLQLPLLNDEQGNSVDISFRLPECDALHLFLWRAADTGKLSLRSWDSVEKSHKQHSVMNDSEEFIEIGLRFTPDESSSTAGILEVQLNGDAVFQCAIALSDATPTPSIMISSGNVNSPERLSRVLFENFQVKAD